ncbi:MAG: cytochrome oxidase subunit III, partial [Acidimicrobiaceae bacterium]|nr:cytochrome oxidase subunit III [Acidimicrobiaceae bacterium]
MSAEPLVADHAHDVSDHGHDPHATTTGLSHTKLAMWVFLGSECLL